MNYQELITDTSNQIIKALESGTLPWEKEWNGCSGNMFCHKNATTQVAYTGMNVLRLMFSATANKFKSNEWMTFKQIQFYGGHLRKGSKGTFIVRWVRINPADRYDLLTEDEDSVKVGRSKMVPKVFTVFNRDQVEGKLRRPLPEAITEFKNEEERDAAVEKIVTDSKAVILEDGSSPCYNPKTDTIHLPKFQDFKDTGAYSDTVLHELAHWTGHKSRLNRLGEKGEEQYAKEELRAEIASMMICSKLGIKHNLENQYSYIDSWLKVLKKDKKEIAHACADACKILQFLKI